VFERMVDLMYQKPGYEIEVELPNGFVVSRNFRQKDENGNPRGDLGVERTSHGTLEIHFGIEEESVSQSFSF